MSAAGTGPYPAPEKIMPGERLLAGHQIASMMGVNKDTVRRWAREGKLTSVRTPGGHRRYPEGQITAILADVR